MSRDERFLIISLSFMAFVFAVGMLAEVLGDKRELTDCRAKLAKEGKE